MAAIGAHIFLSSTPPSRRELLTSICVSPPIRRSILSFRTLAVTEQASSATSAFDTSFLENGSFQKGKDEARASRLGESSSKPDGSTEARKNLKDFFEESRDLIRPDGGPPRWFSPLECGSRLPDSPLLLFLPGTDGTGLGLVMHHQRLGKIFNIWCMHIPVKDRTPFSGLVNLVERTIRSENKRSPNRPIYLVGESLGACIALDVAARNPNIDLVLILANPATSYPKSQLQLLSPFIEAIPEPLGDNLPQILRLVSGENRPTKMVEGFVKGLSLPEGVEELFTDILASSSYPLVLADMLPKETLQWKLQMLNVASASANSHLHAVKAQTLVLCSGSDSLLPSQEEGQRLCGCLQRCDIRSFEAKGHFLFLVGLSQNPTSFHVVVCSVFPCKWERNNL